MISRQVLKQKNLQKNKEANEDRPRIAQQIFFGLIDKHLSPSRGGVVFFPAEILKLSNSDGNSTEEIRKKFTFVSGELDRLLKKKGWKIDFDYFFDFPPSKMLVVEVIPNRYRSMLVHFHVSPCRLRKM